MSFTDRDDYDQSLADHHALKEEPMSLHPSIRDLLDQRAADIARDIDHTQSALLRVTGEKLRTEAALTALRAEEQAITDARKLLARISLEQEAAT